MIDSTIKLITPWKAEQRFYDEEGKLVDVKTIYSSREGTFRDQMGKGLIRFGHGWTTWAKADDSDERS